MLTHLGEGERRIELDVREAPGVDRSLRGGRERQAPPRSAAPRVRRRRDLVLARPAQVLAQRRLRHASRGSDRAEFFCLVFNTSAL